MSFYRAFLLILACLGLLSCRPREDKNLQEPETSKETRACNNDYLFSVQIKGKYGYINCAGNMVIAPRFRNVWEFSEGLAFAAEKGSPNWGVIDKTGKFVIEPKFENGIEFSEGLAYVDINLGGRHYINRKGETALVLSEGYYPGDNFHEGLAVVNKNNKFGFINKTGEVIIPPQYDGAGGFSDGLSVVDINGKAIYIDKTGKQVISQGYDNTFG